MSAASRLALPAGTGIETPRGWLYLEGAFACRSFKQDALLEQIIVDGTLYSKASCVVLVEASHVAGERERLACWPDCGRSAQCWLHVKCHNRLSLRD